MADILLSSTFGLKWGNIVITPRELANHIPGINIIKGKLVFDEVKFSNVDGVEFIKDSLGHKHEIVNLYERIQGT